MERSAPVSISRIHRRMIQVGGVILLLLLFLASFLFLFFQFRTASLQSIAAASESFGNYVESVLRLSNANIRTSAMQMFYTSSVRTLRTSEDLSWSERTIGHRDLGNFASSSSFVENVMVYNEALDTVFTSESSHGSAPTAQFHDQGAVEILLHPENHAYLAPFRRQAGSSTYYSFLFSEAGSRGKSAMLLDINAGWYENQLLGTLSRDRHMIVDGAGQPVIPAQLPLEIPDWGRFQAAFAVDPASGYVLPDRSPFLSSCWVYHRLGNTGWYYLEAFQLEATAPGLVHIQTVVFVLFAALSLVLLALFAYLFVYILPTFLHISRALTAVEVAGKDSTTEKFDELLSSHKALEQSRVLRELQTGSFPAGTRLPIVLVIAGEPQEELYRVLAPYPQVMMARLEPGFTLVFPACTNKGRNQLLAALRGSGAKGPVLVSLPCYSREQLLAAFAALEELKKLAFLYGSQTVLSQELLAECSETSGFRPEMVSAMESALKKGQLQGARAQWLLILNAISRDRYNDFSFALHYVDKMLTGLYLKYELEAAPSMDQSLTSLSALQEAIDQRLIRITEAVAASQQKQADSLCSAVWGKVYEFYQDEDCCSQMIATQLELSQTYLNRQFRAATGMSINDAVQHVRIDKACKLLRDSDLTVEQIAKQVGYRNIKYFFVVFKKYTEKTPSQFRGEAAGGQ